MQPNSSSCLLTLLYPSVELLLKQFLMKVDFDDVVILWERAIDKDKILALQVISLFLDKKS